MNLSCCFCWYILNKLVTRIIRHKHKRQYYRHPQIYYQFRFYVVLFCYLFGFLFSLPLINCTKYQIFAIILHILARHYFIRMLTWNSLGNLFIFMELLSGSSPALSNRENVWRLNTYMFLLCDLILGAKSYWKEFNDGVRLQINFGPFWTHFSHYLLEIVLRMGKKDILCCSQGIEIIFTELVKTEKLLL